MEKLKECPFCGNQLLTIGTDTLLEELEDGNGSGYYAVCCDVLRGGCGSISGYEECRKYAIRKWNRRYK